MFWRKKNAFPLAGYNDHNDDNDDDDDDDDNNNDNNIGNNTVFEMLLYCLCVYVVHFKMFLQISLCWSANLPPLVPTQCQNMWLYTLKC